MNEQTVEDNGSVAVETQHETAVEADAMVSYGTNSVNYIPLRYLIPDLYKEENQFTIPQQNESNLSIEGRSGTVRSWVCSECDRAFTKKYYLTSHIISVHSKLRENVCGDCNRAFTRQSDLKRHEDSVHKKIKRFVCGECNHAFSRHDDLKRHLDSAHNKMKLFISGECGSASTEKRNLERNLNADHRKLNLVIGQQNIDEYSNVNVKAEEQIAIETESMVSVDLDTNMTMIHLLPDERRSIAEFFKDDTQHIYPASSQSNRTGDGQSETVKLYFCSECEKAFAKKYYLTSHITSVHKKIRENVCIECNRAFTRQRDLKRHEDSVHKKIKRFACAKCERTFSRQDDLKKHFDSVHEKLKNFVCRQCGRAFTRHESFTMHLSKCHS